MMVLFATVSAFSTSAWAFRKRNVRLFNWMLRERNDQKMFLWYTIISYSQWPKTSGSFISHN